MRVLALDIGDSRVGVASGNSQTAIASPVKVLPTAEVTQNARSWKTVLQDYEPDMLLFGLPFSMDGSKGKQAQHVKDLAQKIAVAAHLDYEFVDERLSSAQAKRIMREANLKERDMRGKLDAIAASLFLETWLVKHAKEQDQMLPHTQAQNCVQEQVCVYEQEYAQKQVCAQEQAHTREQTHTKERVHAYEQAWTHGQAQNKPYRKEY